MNKEYIKKKAASVVGSHVETAVLTKEELAKLFQDVEKHTKREIVEWAREERVAQGMDSEGHPQDYYIDYNDLITHLTTK